MQAETLVATAWLSESEMETELHCALRVLGRGITDALRHLAERIYLPVATPQDGACVP